MPGPLTRLTLLPYVQTFDGTDLSVRLVLIPNGSPLEPLNAGDPAEAPFANADLSVQLVLTHGLDVMPPGGTTSETDLALPAVPGAGALFNELAALYAIDPAPAPANPRRAMTVLKHLPISYRDASGVGEPRTPFARVDDSYACAKREMPTVQPRPARAAPISWGRVIAIALRQPVLAEALGLIREITVPVPNGALQDGGWFHVTLTAPNDAGLLSVPGAIAMYATRIGPITAATALFSAVLFPVPPSGSASYDVPLIEAIDYGDGFAKVVHAAQQRTADPDSDLNAGPRPRIETGIRLGWDDEQIAIWLNRQVQILGATDPDTTMGVAGYRVDVREAGNTTWRGLCHVKGKVAVGAHVIGNVDGEQPIETHPVQLDGDATGQFWLAPYFARWTGGALVGGDPIGRQLTGAPAPAAWGIAPVAPPVRLRYGHTYEFRVRLADHAGGGPGISDGPTVPATSPIAALAFRRFVPPGVPEIESPATPDVDHVRVRRPRLGYPAYASTDVADPIAALLADLPHAQADSRAVGLPDPDVDAVSVTVRARALAFDPSAIGGYVDLYTATRRFPAAAGSALNLQLDWRDVPDATTIVDAANGPLVLPTNRDIRLDVRAVGRDDPNLDYFGADDVRTGDSASVDLRVKATNERNLLAIGSPADFLRAIRLRPDLADDPASAPSLVAVGDGQPGDSIARLASALELDASGLSLRGRAGRRTVFGASAGLRHVLGPDHASITFGSRSDLFGQWVIALRATVRRDWTWDGLTEGITVTREGSDVGRIELLRTLASEGATISADRTETDVVYLDTFDPKPDPGTFPRSVTLHYELTPQYAGSPAQTDASVTQDVRLPVTTPPFQIPRLVSAGIALSPYVRSDDYSSTDARQRQLWLQFEADPDDPDDGLFARVLRNAPDPSLADGNDDLVPDLDVEPPLPIDPEYTRLIAPGQSDDRAGLGAMQALTRGDAPGYYLLPLPPGVASDDPQLLGFYTYEFRIGHIGQWSTAHGRFGIPLRVAGIQHPAPTLPCTAIRYTTGVAASAAYASPVYAGKNLRPSTPATSLWVLLYAQVTRSDRSDQQNVLLGHRRATRKESRQLGRFKPDRLDAWATAGWPTSEIKALLDSVGLDDDAPLSVLAVEVLPGGEPAVDPMGMNLGQERILRTSPLIPVPDVCLPSA